MDTTKIKRFAQYARRTLRELVSTKLKKVLTSDSDERRREASAVSALDMEVHKHGEEQVVDKVAYIWFNRFCALRFMDAREYTAVKVLTPRLGEFQPEILAEAKSGALDEDLVPASIQKKVKALLDGEEKSDDPQQEAYRLLVVAACNHYYDSMPFLFEKISDYTELLMPDDLLSGNSIVAYTRENITSLDCESVEVIGWLYQFYISERKDEVFASKKKVEAEDIPAATQLFTPNYIVRYMVENSLGRLWMLNFPDSNLVDQMDYYIQPEEVEDFIRISNPEELKVCDPACGSGHILIYAFDLLYTIYTEQGYASKDIPRLILEKNLYGIELDERAGELAAFALAMKGREKYRRFFNKKIEPQICVLEKLEFADQEIKDYMAELGDDLFTIDLRKTLADFEEADNLGSLIRPTLQDSAGLQSLLEGHKIEDNVYLFDTHRKIKVALKQAEFLRSKYHCVIANPPYMGAGNMNPALSKFAIKEYPDSKADLFAMFMERSLDLLISTGYMGMVNMQSWMFLSSFEKLRTKLLNEKTILSMAHLGPRGFDSIGGEVVQTTSFVIQNQGAHDFKGSYLRLIEGKNEIIKELNFKEAVKDLDCSWLFRACSDDFKKIPSTPIAYWVSENIRATFDNDKVGDITISDGQTKTGDNDRYLRMLWEVSSRSVGKDKKWVKHPKGGKFRRWYGNVDNLINWSEEARMHYRKDRVARILPNYLWWKKGFCWTLITGGEQSFRIVNDDEIFNLAAPTLFPKDDDELNYLLALVNTPIASYITKVMNPTLNMNVGEIQNIPLVDVPKNRVNIIATEATSIAKFDWNIYETAWDYKKSPLVLSEDKINELQQAYSVTREIWQSRTKQMQCLEEANNRIFIDAYDLQDELTTEVPLKEITLTCNPHYRYPRAKDEDEREALLLADTMKEFISYAVGCMFGRYSLDHPGLIIANQGESLEDYFEKIGKGQAASGKPEVQFMPDEDNVIPILDDTWFEDDIVERFRVFLKVTFGEDNFEENLSFLEKAIGKDIRKYFLKDFYTEHNKMYKKLPIYWLFSSPKGSFNALIYMHRYQPSTASVILNDYLRTYVDKLEARKSNLDQVEVSANASPKDKRDAVKEQKKIREILNELEDYERQILYPLASEQLAIDLDDGVKVNYNKFGKALKKVTGLSGK